MPGHVGMLTGAEKETLAREIDNELCAFVARQVREILAKRGRTDGSSNSELIHRYYTENLMPAIRKWEREFSERLRALAVA